MKKNPSVTIGIPAYNEAKNVKNMLASLAFQKGSFHIDSIVLVCDGCSDRTAPIAQSIKKKLPALRVIEEKKRHGKMHRLNQIYALNKSDILITFDADIVLSHEHVIENMVKHLRDDKRIALVASHQIPVSPSGVMEKVLHTAFRLWEETRIYVNGGDHIHNLQGSATAIRSDAVEHIRYPRNLATDQGYLYLKGKEFGKFVYAYDAPVIYRPVQTFHDFRILSARTLQSDQQTLVNHFGKKIMHEFAIPSSYKFGVILSFFLKSPVYTSSALILNFLVRLFPLKQAANKSATWQIVSSTKEAIAL